MIWEVQRLPQKKRGQGQGISSRSHLKILGPLEATRQTWKCGLESWQPLPCQVGSGGERKNPPEMGESKERKNGSDGAPSDQLCWVWAWEGQGAAIPKGLG